MTDDGYDYDEYTDDTPTCAYCQEPIDYCQGHGEIGDPVGFAFLANLEEF